ncbi:MAG: tetratricopeptide repeat protein [Ferruginibacter sp.]
MIKTKYLIKATICGLGIACSFGAAKAQVLPTSHKSVFMQSLRAGDVTTAIQAANYIVAADSKSSYRDSLAILYYNTNNLNAAFYWASDILRQSPAKISMLEVKASCLKKGNNPIPAIDAYTELLKLQPGAVYAYELMNLQYTAQRLLECAAVGMQTLQANRIDSNIVAYYSTDGKTRKETPLKAAIYNLYGMALADLKKLPEAQKAFEQALATDDTYAMAIKNLETVKALLATVPENPEQKKSVEKPKG